MNFMLIVRWIPSLSSRCPFCALSRRHLLLPSVEVAVICGGACLRVLSGHYPTMSWAMGDQQTAQQHTKFLIRSCYFIAFQFMASLLLNDFVNATDLPR